MDKEGEDKLNLLFYQFRYHTNQHPIMNYLISEGHQVDFVSQLTQPIEEYSAIRPNVIPNSVLFSPITHISNILYKFGVINKYPDRLKRQYGILSNRELFRYIKSTDPDLVIIKSYHPSSIQFYLICKYYDLNVVFLDQLPLYGENTSIKKTLSKYFVENILKKEFKRMSPIKGDENKPLADKNSYYAPFVIMPRNEQKITTSDQNSAIRIIMVGKYRSKKKNHIALLTAVNKLSKEYDFTVTIVGERMISESDNFNKLREYTQKNSMENIIDFKWNLSYDEMQKEYSRHDVFVLPSKSEKAAVSPLEAMSHGLAVVCTTENGTSEYIKDGYNGYLINPQDNTLICALEDLLSDRAKIREMGDKSIELVKKNHSPAQFEALLYRLAKKEK